MYKSLSLSFGKRFEIIFCENGSTDSTVHILRSFAKKKKYIRVITLDKPNYGGAMKAGFLAARGIFMANASIDWYDIDHLKRAIPLLKSADIVVGTKANKGFDRRPFFRRLISRGYHILLNIFFGLRVSDTHSINIFRTKKMQPIIRKTVMDGSVFPSEVLIRAQRSHLRIVEKDIVVTEKRARKKSITTRTFKAIAGLVKLRLILWRENQKNIFYTISLYLEDLFRKV
ncbi:MAG: glycosyltransferase family 2 protein [Nanoarchaeota archaeon]